MTYKTSTINSISPDSNNNIQLNLNDISDHVSYTSGQGNKKFKYKTDNTRWESESTITDDFSTVYFWFYTTAGYTSGSTAYSSDSTSNLNYYFWRGHGGYGTKYIKSPGAASVASGVNNKWATGVTISDAGTYKLTASLPLETQSTSNYMSVRWHDGSNYFGPHAYLTKDGKTNNILCAVKTITSETTFYIRIVSLSGNSYLGDTREGYCTSINIVKID